MEKGRLFQPDFLIIGEDRAMCKRLSGLLAGMDYRFQISYSMLEAHEWLELGYFNIVLFDQPADTSAMRRLLNHIFNRYPDIRVIAFIEMQDRSLCDSLLDRSCCDILQKSFDDVEFIKRMRHAVNHFALEMEYHRVQEEKSKLETQLQQALKMGALGSMAGGVIHDLNNMLGVIMANADLALVDLPEGAPAIPRIEQAVEASARAKEILQRVLTYYRCRPRDEGVRASALRSRSP